MKWIEVHSTDVNWTELNWIQLNWIELNWTEWNLIELKLSEFNWSELKLVELSWSILALNLFEVMRTTMTRVSGEDEFVMPMVAMRMRGGRKEGGMEGRRMRQSGGCTVTAFWVIQRVPHALQRCQSIGWSPGTTQRKPPKHHCKYCTTVLPFRFHPLAFSILQSGNKNSSSTWHRIVIVASCTSKRLAHPLPAPKGLLSIRHHQALDAELVS